MLGVDSDLHSRANSMGEKTPRKMLSFTGFQANEKEKYPATESRRSLAQLPVGGP